MRARPRRGAVYHWRSLWSLRVVGCGWEMVGSVKQGDNHTRGILHFHLKRHERPRSLAPRPVFAFIGDIVQR